MESETGLRRILLCQESDLADGDAFRLPADDAGTADDIAVFRDAGRYYALNDVCPHAQASLSEGWVEDGEVECPMHSARFDLETGEALSLPATEPATAYRVETRAGGVWLLVETGAGR